MSLTKKWAKLDEDVQRTAGRKTEVVLFELDAKITYPLEVTVVDGAVKGYKMPSHSDLIKALASRKARVSMVVPPAIRAVAAEYTVEKILRS